MSLLLDALKKAADDKQQALQIELSGLDESNKKSSTTNKKEEENSANDESVGEHNSANSLPAENKKDAKRILDADALTLSDDALSMLIYNTNHEVKKRRRILVFSALMVGLGILISGGMFYYHDMQKKILALEHQHQIAMQAIHEKTNSEAISPGSEVMKNLVSGSNLEEKVQIAKQQIAAEKSSSQSNTKAQNKAPANKVLPTKAMTAAISIQKTQKTNPVGEKLEAAWLAYKSAYYGEASALYKSVLSIEGSNRDALLGLAAIAVVEKNIATAKNIYLKLLELDPRDPIAIAALASLPDKQARLSDKDYLLTVLQKNPDAHHLNFALGNVFAQQNNWKSAQQYYFKAWQFNDENADYIFNLAVSLDQLGKQSQALRFYEDSLLKSKNKQISFSLEAVKKRINELSGL